MGSNVDTESEVSKVCRVKRGVVFSVIAHRGLVVMYLVWAGRSKWVVES